MSVLSRLHKFEGRSLFTTWAYKFAIFQAGAAVRRAAWNNGDVCLHDVPEFSGISDPEPESYAECQDMSEAVMKGLRRALTPHQRRVVVALLIEEIPFNVLADRMDTTRGALYKTLHDARKRLRGYLSDEGYLPTDGGAAK